MYASMDARRTFSQFCSFKIRRTTILNYIKFADLLIARLQNWERVRRALIKESTLQRADVFAGLFISKVAEVTDV